MNDPAATLHDAFELRRDATEDPSELFDLAVAEAQAMDALETASPAWRLASLVRVLEGGREGTRVHDLAWAAGRLEALMSSEVATLDPHDRAVAHDVLFRVAVENGAYAAAHEHAVAALSLWTALEPPAEPREIADACERVFSSGDTFDAALLARWTEAERAVGDPGRWIKLLAATAHAAWVTAEGAPDDAALGARRREATQAWVDAAVARWQATPPGDDRGFTAAGAAEALGARTELETVEGSAQTVHEAATLWLEAAGEAEDVEGVTHATAVLAALAT